MNRSVIIFTWTSSPCTATAFGSIRFLHYSFVWCHQSSRPIRRWIQGLTLCDSGQFHHIIVPPIPYVPPIFLFHYYCYFIITHWSVSFLLLYIIYLYIDILLLLFSNVNRNSFIFTTLVHFCHLFPSTYKIYRIEVR